MAEKTYFVANLKENCVEKKYVEYKFNPGFSIVQKQKNIKDIHNNIKEREKDAVILEVSSKSDTDLGVKLSAFHLGVKRKKDGKKLTVEKIFQSSKVFENGGPYLDILELTSREAKKYEELKASGKLIEFCFKGEKWPLEPKTFFYDWIYINTLWVNIKEKNIDLNELLKYNVFTDVEFNHKKSINCQASAVALFMVMYGNGILEESLQDKEKFKESLEKIYQIPKDEDKAPNIEKTQVEQLNLLKF